MSAVTYSPTTSRLQYHRRDAGLASGFGMGPGVSLPLLTTDKHPGHTVGVWSGVLCQILHSGREHDIMTMSCFLLVVPHKYFWVCVVLVVWPISTSSLHILRCVQVWPINPVVFRGPSNETSS